MAKKPETPPSEQDEDHIVPIDYDPDAAERDAAKQRDAERDAYEHEHDGMTDLEMAMEMLTVFNVEFTLIQDESGSTVEIDGGNRGTMGFSGLAITMNFAPLSKREKFLFIGLAK